MSTEESPENSQASFGDGSLQKLCLAEVFAVSENSVLKTASSKVQSVWGLICKIVNGWCLILICLKCQLFPEPLETVLMWFLLSTYPGVV